MKFKPGDIVECVNDEFQVWGLVKGELYQVRETSEYRMVAYLRVSTLKGKLILSRFKGTRFKKVRGKLVKLLFEGNKNAK
jgi:hypothetical protein